MDLSSPTSTELSPQDAAPPFNGPFADIILRSCDGIRFHVSKPILSIASPVFADMFRLAGPHDAAASSDEMCNGLPLVPMAEDAATLDLLLRWCYPVAHPTLVTLDDMQRMVAATQKYDIHALDNAIGEALQRQLALDPLGVFRVAVADRLDDMARKAARGVLGVPLAMLVSPAIDNIEPSALIALIRYHVDCGAAASAVTLRRDFFTGNHALGMSTNGPQCKQCSALDPQVMESAYRTWYAPRFLWQYLDRAGRALLIRPHAGALPLIDAWDCSSCHKGYGYLIQSKVFVDNFNREVNAAIDTVPVPDFFQQS
ncbi:hypothetical protein FA95DRAFT_1395729 [Auriscalpium vulgare]|uniref:Uncharacterized protein n=1 Tax=Auriscalpium vulgare TaxID=40419 RepID=A0ACB8RS15_9AGAM|nr:hypothetical protein FA95DRAFT_1395729 [Auriscalpium vulgare]